MVRKDLIDTSGSIVLEHTNNHALLNRDAVMDILDMAIEYYKLDNYIDTIIFDNEADCKGSFDSDDKSILVNLRVFNDLVLDSNEGKEIFKKEKERLLATNASIVETIMHEITHCCQYKSCVEKPDSMIARLTMDQFKFDKYGNAGNDYVSRFYKALLKEYEKGERFYDLTPIERMARIKSALFICDMLEDKKFNKYKTSRAYFELSLIQNVLKGYKSSDKSNPVLNYISIQDSIKYKYGVHINTLNSCYIRSKKGQFSLEKRLFYGLEADEEELSIIRDTRDKNKIYKKHAMNNKRR